LTLKYPIARHQLSNGMRVVVSEDHNVPAASIAVCYDVGSRHETLGRTGLAHLHEHLMFEGSAHVRPGEHIQVMQEHGGLVNAGTGHDTTTYIEHLPAGAVDLALWLEADRMATLTDGLTQDRLDNQRAVIGQEIRQRIENVPFGTTGDRLAAAVYPAGHPYHHPVGGSLADLAAATVDDVRDFFARWYTPANAVLAITGDVTAETVIASAERYFGPVPAGPRPAQPPVQLLGTSTVPSRDETTGPVPFPQVALGWRLPVNSVTDPEIFAADAALRILADGPGSRAHQVLARDMHAVHQVAADTSPRNAGNSIGVITAAAMPAADPASIEKALLAEVEVLASGEPTEQEMTRVRAAIEAGLLEGVSASLGRAMHLAGFTTGFDAPEAINSYLDRLAAVTPAMVTQAAAKWLRPEAAATVITRPAAPSPRPRLARSNT
jgi:predicted Zn-dependent peptidase